MVGLLWYKSMWLLWFTPRCRAAPSLLPPLPPQAPSPLASLLCASSLPVLLGVAMEETLGGGWGRGGQCVLLGPLELSEQDETSVPRPGWPLLLGKPVNPFFF